MNDTLTSTYIVAAMQVGPGVGEDLRHPVARPASTGLLAAYGLGENRESRPPSPDSFAEPLGEFAGGVGWLPVAESSRGILPTATPPEHAVPTECTTAQRIPRQFAIH
jgi:hypothetical protein